MYTLSWSARNMTSALDLCSTTGWNLISELSTGLPNHGSLLLVIDHSTTMRNVKKMMICELEWTVLHCYISFGNILKDVVCDLEASRHNRIVRPNREYNGWVLLWIRTVLNWPRKLVTWKAFRLYLYPVRVIRGLPTCIFTCQLSWQLNRSA